MMVILSITIFVTTLVVMVNGGADDNQVLFKNDGSVAILDFESAQQFISNASLTRVGKYHFGQNTSSLIYFYGHTNTASKKFRDSFKKIHKILKDWPHTIRLGVINCWSKTSERNVEFCTEASATDGRSLPQIKFYESGDTEGELIPWMEDPGEPNIVKNIFHSVLDMLSHSNPNLDEQDELQRDAIVLEENDGYLSKRTILTAKEYYYPNEAIYWVRKSFVKQNRVNIYIFNKHKKHLRYKNVKGGQRVFKKVLRMLKRNFKQLPHATTPEPTTAETTTAEPTTTTTMPPTTTTTTEEVVQVATTDEIKKLPKNKNGNSESMVNTDEEEEEEGIPNREVEPVGTTEEMVEPVGTEEEMVEPVGTTEEMVAPVETSEEMVEPVGATEKMVEPVGTTEEMVEPVETTEKMVEPVRTTKKMVATVGTTEEMVAPVETSEEMVEPVGTTEEMVAPVETTEEMVEPVGTTEKMVEPVGTTEEMVEPVGTTEEMVKPVGTTEEKVEVEDPEAANSILKISTESLPLVGPPKKTTVRHVAAVSTSAVRQKLSKNGAKINKKEQIYTNDIDTGILYLWRDMDEAIYERNQTLAGKKLENIKTFTKLVAKYLKPSGNLEIKFKNISDQLEDKKSMKFADWSKAHWSINLLNTFENENDDNWMKCRGSSTQFRGKECGFWLVLHTLVTNYWLNANGTTNVESGANFAIFLKDFVNDYLFNDYKMEYKENFVNLSDSMIKSVSSLESAVIWLWKIHNEINKMAAGKWETEDPKYPKVQWPTKKNCPKCYVTAEKFDETQVLKYIKLIYSSEHRKFIKREKKQDYWQDY